MIKVTLAAATVLAGLSFGVTAPTASAVTAIGNSSLSPIVSGGRFDTVAYVKKKVVVNKKGKKTVWVYIESKHGVRYRAKRPGFAYYYGGYYYSRPWWTICIGC